MERLTKRLYRHRQEHYKKEVHDNLILASNCISDSHSHTGGTWTRISTWDDVISRARKKPVVITQPASNDY